MSINSLLQTIQKLVITKANSGLPHDAHLEELTVGRTDEWMVGGLVTPISRTEIRVTHSTRYSSHVLASREEKAGGGPCDFLFTISQLRKQLSVPDCCWNVTF